MCGPGARSIQSSCSRLAHVPERSMRLPCRAAAAWRACAEAGGTVSSETRANAAALRVIGMSGSLPGRARRRVPLGPVGFLLEVEAGDPGAREVGGILDDRRRSEEHTSELQSQSNLVCRLLLEK